MPYTVSWEQLLNTARFGELDKKPEPARTPFNKDQDKIIFSEAFRRLGRKTQVHPLAKNDHVHNRLTHSLEVSRVGRSLGIQAGRAIAANLPEGLTAADVGDIVQATCLAHDIGNPPFGHTGENAIRSWFESPLGAALTEGLTARQVADLRQFEGNAQGLRILCNNEYYTDEGGMRLTYATLASFIKYPWVSSSPVEFRPNKNKFGVFDAEVSAFEEIAQAVGLKPIAEPHCYARHPLVCLMEAADDFCYGLLDLEDGIELRLIEWDEFYELIRPLLSKDKKHLLETKYHNYGHSHKAALIRGEVIDRCIESAGSAFHGSLTKILNGDVFDLISLCDRDVSHYVSQAKMLARDKIFSHQIRKDSDAGAFETINTLLDILCPATLDYLESHGSGFRCTTAAVADVKHAQSVLTGCDFDVSTFVHELQNEHEKYNAIMRVLDFVSGMTDNYAVYLAKRFKS